MYIRKTRKSHKGKTYTNYLLVESVSTPKGPRQRIICSLGSLDPVPVESMSRTHAPRKRKGLPRTHLVRRSITPHCPWRAR